MPRRSAALKPQFVRLFDDRSRMLYNSMAYRKAVLRIGGIPFTLTEWRAWLIKQLGGTPEGVVKCAYCNLWLNISNVVPDHIRALKAGGSAALDNLTLACGPCNRRKGALSDSGFRNLIQFLLTLDQWDMNDVLMRLAAAGEGMKAQWKRNKKTREAKNEEPF